MRPIVSMTLAACAVVLMTSPILAQAQTPAPAAAPAAAAGRAGGTPDAMPFDIPYGQSIGLELAKQAVAAAEAEAKKRNWKMNIAVVDTNGEAVMFERMESAQIGRARFRSERHAPRRASAANPGCLRTPLKPVTAISRPSMRPSLQAPAAIRSCRAAS